MTPQRKQLNYVIDVLEQKYYMVAALGPATDNPEIAEQERAALEFAAERLQRPYYDVSPFD